MASNNEKVKRKLTKKSKNKIENQPFYDSDEELGMGKLTLKEVKARLNKPFLKLDARGRYSTSFLTQTNFYTSGTELTENRNEMEHINRDDSIPAISEYLTASEDVNEIESSVCPSNYLEPNSTNIDKSSVYLSTIDVESSKNNFVNDTCSNFIQKALAATVDDIENEYQSLIEPTSSSNESADSSISVSKNDLLILISSDEDELETQENLSFEIKRKPLSFVTEESEERCSSFSENEYITGHNENGSVKECRTTTNFGIDRGTSGDKSMFSSISSPISIPEIDLHQFNDSSVSPLNNTLDKINAILAGNLSLNENSDVEEQNEPQTKTCTLISASFLQTPNIFKEETPWTPEKTNIASFKTPETVKFTHRHTPITGKSNIKKSPDFRIPDLPKKHKLPTNLKANFKDVVSPVRMYIKYSPKPILKQTVHARDKSCSKLNQSPRVEVETESKMKSLEIPNVMYKPSKKQIFALDESTHFPVSIDKMIKKSTVIKHERHPLKPHVCPNETLDPEAELTMSFLNDCSNLSEIENVSILHKKTALRN